MKQLIIIAILVSSISACRKNDDSEVANAVDPEIQLSGLKNDWQSGCHKVALDVVRLESRRVQYVIGSDIRRITTYFDNDTCATPVLSITEWGTYEKFEKVASFHKIDIHWQKVTVLARADGVRDLLNNLKFCSFAQWSTNGEQDVTAQTTEHPVLDQCLNRTPAWQYDLLLIKGKTLQLGSSKAGRDKLHSETRPTEIDNDLIFNRE